MAENKITFDAWYSQYDDAGNCVNTLEDTIVSKMNNKLGIRTVAEWDKYYLITEINDMVEQAEALYNIHEDASFTKQADGTYISMFKDTSDDGDFAEYVVGWLSSHDIVWECELSEEGVTEVVITL